MIGTINEVDDNIETGQFTNKNHDSPRRIVAPNSRYQENNLSLSTTGYKSSFGPTSSTTTQNLGGIGIVSNAGRDFLIR